MAAGGATRQDSSGATWRICGGVRGGLQRVKPRITVTAHLMIEVVRSFVWLFEQGGRAPCARGSRLHSGNPAPNGKVVDHSGFLEGKETFVTAVGWAESPPLCPINTGNGRV